MGSAIDLFVSYRFLKLLTTPFKKTEAFKLGIIDEKGHRIMKTGVDARFPEVKLITTKQSIIKIGCLTRHPLSYKRNNFLRVNTYANVYFSSIFPRLQALTEPLFIV